MAKKKKVDAGLQFIKDIHFDAGKGFSDMYGKLAKHYDRHEVDRILKEYKQLMQNTNTMEQFYEFKNSTYEISTAFSECYDGNIIRAAVNYIADHKDLFGQTILEVGCDCGIMTLYLAKAFPEAKIVAIDRCAAAIEHAKARLQQYGIENVKFVAADVKDMDQKFDTVFSMRTMQENWKQQEFLRGCEFLPVQIESYIQMVAEYAQVLGNCLADGGHLVSFERNDVDPLLAAWLCALNEQGCVIDRETFKLERVAGTETRSTFTIFAAAKAQPMEKESMIAYWYELLGNPVSNKVFYGWHALKALEDMAKTCICGGIMKTLLGTQQARFGLYTMEDESSLLYYSTTESGNKAEIVPVAKQDEYTELVVMQLGNARGWGLVVDMENEEAEEPDEE